MRSFCFTILLCLFAFIQTGQANSASKSFDLSGLNQKHQKKNVLILNAYHQNYHWADEIMRGVFSEMGDKESYELYVEYMDTKRCSDSTYYTHLKDIYLYKYKKVKIDVILACDDNALNFMLMYRDDIFPEVPVSFCGVVDFHPSRIEGKQHFTGVYETYDVPANLDMIMKLHPTTKKVVVISDVTESGKALIARMKRAEPNYKDKISIDYLINKEPDEIEEYFTQKQENTVVIWAIYLRLPDGRFISSDESISFVSSVTSLPIYCIWDVVGQGVVGGKITTPFYQGSTAADIANRILGGEKASDIAVSGSPMFYKFDYTQLVKHQISIDKIPKGSVVLNQPDSFWQAHKKIITTLLVIIVSLVLVVLTLGYLYRKSKRAEIEIKNKNKELELSKAKAEESDRLKTAFLANLSHEIRTPMNGIIGFTELVRNSNLSPDEVNQFMDVIHQSGNRLLHLIDDLVYISKIEANQIIINRANVSINELLDGVYYFFKPLAQQKGIAFTCEKNFEGEVLAYIDKMKLEQVLTNLLSNSFKFTSKGSITLISYLSDGYIFFKVKDTGIGITEDMQKVIFNRFIQVESSSKNGTEGMGLGLSISKSFVEMMGGEIWVESQQGLGSEFFVKLPLEEDQDSGSQG
ncbi:sensor histidine kinase [Carboxylicivirga linearis]|uniref:histidine kinase n=1 Tax=Carboxylicivirga linearis TaxID=1628157 RepID=A0ABS5K0E1_9BACT|nr:ABC transporter substrate binding protein [Carboxylicivirga linearis]MBS2100550.1 hypothetical protein [Carboxylicivirga linearis]